MTPIRPPEATAASVAIVGMGSRGLGLLERLVAHCLTRPAPVTVHLVDPQPLGPGFHLAGQPDHLLLNTVCSQLTAFADEQMVEGPAPLSGPSLAEWCQERDLRLADDGYTVRAGEGRPIRPNDFLPRRLLSEYLAWAAAEIVAAAPDCLTVVRHRCEAVDVRPGPDGREAVELADGTLLDADAVFVTVGHHSLYRPAAPAAEPRLITRPYPLPEALDGIAPGERVAVLGMGLTAMDVIASLTLGRGGRHEPHASGLRYVPSGREPGIVLANRSGLPSRSRPYLAPDRVRCAPLALTADRVAGLRARRADGRLHFGEDVLPLIEAEMELAYYRTLRARECGDAAAAGREFADRDRQAGYETLLQESRDRWGPSPLSGVLAPAGGRHWADHDAYARWFTDEVTADLAEARAGLGVSPLKEALEVLRDHRDVLRTAVDAPGLDDASLAGFFGAFNATVNRLVIGPQLDRSAELLALVEAGVVRLGPGPRPKVIAPAGQGPWILESTALQRPVSCEVDHVVHAHVREPAPDRVPGSLLGTLVGAGRVRTLGPRGGPAHGLEVTREGRGVGHTGQAQPRLYFLGPHTEGSSYYNHYVPSPGMPSRALMDAELALSTSLPSVITRKR
ncbi:FAD/NAD(P)-binding protein [Streptomyces naphthomycinicus]|uniref:FAD/NAD(P)-binding protein n=1 Tax=Streptomyces naphthomycinicus TaxID=2872625 RepID=UPI001CED348D|nr:FAD/NAD(P)-binding protein [Streptomyces sp. TML10]